MKNTNLEYRAMMLDGVQADTNACTIMGRAIAYNKMSNPLRTMNGDKFLEVILPGAVEQSMSQNDILAYKEHNPEMLLGRKSAGTLELEQRSDGLYAKIYVPNTSYGRDTMESAKRGDLKGFSFGFSSPVTRNYTKDGMKIREISGMDLREISVVSNPAYNDTTLNVRSEDFAPEEFNNSIEVFDPSKETIINKLQSKNTISEDIHKSYEMKHRFISLLN
jgi:uncharacterized protein